jgi:uncharacterized protein (DUF885 family)
MRRNYILSLPLIGLTVALAACGKPGADKSAAEPSPAAVAAAAGAAEEEAGAAFDALVTGVTRDYFALFPEQATYYGAPGELAGEAADTRLNDRSPAGEEARRAMLERSLERLRAVEPSALDARRAQLRDILIAQFDGVAAPARVAPYGGVGSVYGNWYTPYAVIQNSGAIVDIANLMQAQQRVASLADAEAFLARLAAFGPTIDGVREKLIHDEGLGVIAPDFVLAKSHAVLAAFTASAPDAHPLITDFKGKLIAAGVPSTDDLSARAAAILGETVYPAQRALMNELLRLKKSASHDAGVWRLPSGPALYQAMIRQMTDTDLTAEEIHQIGLDDVARITAEMDALLKQEGYGEGTVGARMTKLAAEARFFYPNTDEGKTQILDDIRAQMARISALAPQWFGVLPKYAVEVRAVPAFSQDSAPGGYYDSPAIDGSRPGIYWINLRDTAIWPKFAVPTLTYHESIPGHHFQNAIALGQDAPLILNVLSSNAYGEGWGLYAEALAKEMGVYEGDPFGDLGRLQDELHRAVRLVVDTGMHAKKWSREQAIAYVVDIEGVHPSEAESEIERYVVWPGQALGYKMGMLKIQDLRAKASAALGEKFDIRGFHDVVLVNGAAPLPVLERNVEDWIEALSAQP